MSDKTLHSDATKDEIYFAVFHCMFSATQKMTLREDILSMDSLISGKCQLSLLIELLLNGLV